MYKAPFKLKIFVAHTTRHTSTLDFGVAEIKGFFSVDPISQLTPSFARVPASRCFGGISPPLAQYKSGQEQKTDLIELLSISS
jgi:hypothetical protein